MTVEYDDIGSIVGLQEISILLGCAPRTSHAWANRHLLPPSDYPSINGLRAWNRKTIEKWAKATGRMPTEPGVPLTVRRGGRPIKRKRV